MSTRIDTKCVCENGVTDAGNQCGVCNGTGIVPPDVGALAADLYERLMACDGDEHDIRRNTDVLAIPLPLLWRIYDTLRGER